jgi:hypothetical protein
MRLSRCVPYFRGPARRTNHSKRQFLTRKRATRTSPLRIEVLEDRTVLTGLGFALPDHILYQPERVGSPLSTSLPTGYTPAQIRHAYAFDQIALPGGAAADGSGTTIAIVDAYDDPTIANDLHAFDLQFRLPDPSFTKVNQSGGTVFPPADGTWATEIALDVEWAHAIAPAAKILLVEANDNQFTNLLAGVSYAANQPGVVAVSMSWDGGEFDAESSVDSYFLTPSGHGGVTFLAASGDTGAPPMYPATSPNVIAVGGTTLNLDGQGDYLSESGWSGSGGGISAFEPQPAYQGSLISQSFRTNPDVAYDADPYTGFPVYDSYNNGTAAPWSQIGGTSDAAPQWAALIAIADQGRLLAGESTLDGPSQTLPMVYQLSNADFRDITTGSSDGTPPYSAGPGYDLVTGRGTPIANKIVADLIGVPITVKSATTVTSSANPQAAGQPVSWTASVTAATGVVNFVNFETGDFSQTANHVGGAMVTSPALSGTYSLELQRSGSVANVEIRQSGTTYYNLPTAYYRFLFEYTANPGEGGVVNFQDTSSGFKAALHLSSTGKLLFYSSTGTLLATGTTTLVSGQVYALSAMIGTGSTAAWQIEINGSLEMSGSGNLGSTNNGSLKLGGNGAYTTTYYYDDVAVNSQAYPGPVPTGTVQFIVDNSPSGNPVALADGTATSLPVTTLAAGTHTVTASYSGDRTYAASTGMLSGGQTITGQPATSATTVTSSANPAVYGQTVTFTATVTGSGSGTPTGTVAFFDGSTSLGQGTLSTSGGISTATFSTAGLSAGTHTITASYSGDSNYLASSGSLQQTVNAATGTSTTTSVTSSANPQAVGQPVSWTATVTAATGVVNFVNFETGDFSQTASHVGGAIVTSPALSGTYSLELQRSGSAANVEIRQSGTTYYNLPTAYYRFLFEYTSNPGEGGIVNFQDMSSGFKAALHLSSTGNLLFYDSTGTLLATGPTTLVSGQIYALSAMIGTGSTAAWQIEINGAVEMSGSGNLGSNNNGSLKLGGNGAYTATYYYDDVAVNSQAYPGPVPSGTVQFMVDGTPSGSPVALSDGTATSTPTSTLAAGIHTVTASYSGDNTYAASSGTLPGGQMITAETGQVNYVDFETGDFSQTASHVGGAIVTSPALDGTYSLQLQRNNSVANVEIRQSGTTYYNLPTAYYRFLFEYTSNSSEGGIVNFQDTSSGFKAALHLSSTGKLLFYSSTGTLLATGTTTLLSGQVYAISAMIGTGSTAAWQIEINGAVEMSGSGNLDSNNNGSLKLGGNGAYTATYYYDDVAINSQTYPNEGGPARAAALVPAPLLLQAQRLNTVQMPGESPTSPTKSSSPPQTVFFVVPAQPLWIPIAGKLAYPKKGTVPLSSKGPSPFSDTAAIRRAALATPALDLLFADWCSGSGF